jgi:hypothetical protein
MVFAGELRGAGVQCQPRRPPHWHVTEWVGSFHGELDDVRVFDEVLTLAQIDEIAEARISTRTSNPLHL